MSTGSLHVFEVPAETLLVSMFPPGAPALEAMREGRARPGFHRHQRPPALRRDMRVVMALIAMGLIAVKRGRACRRRLNTQNGHLDCGPAVLPARSIG